MVGAEHYDPVLAAPRTALLAFYDEHTSVMARQRPVFTRRERLMGKALERLRLKWLAIAVALVVSAVRSKRGGRSMFGDVRPIAREYGQLAGKDPDVARAEVLRIVKQLLPLDARMRAAGELPRPVTRAEFELAAGALDGFVAGPNHEMDWMTGTSFRPGLVQEYVETTGAVLGGRDGWDHVPDASSIYGGAWRGPVFVLTHHPEDATPPTASRS